MKNFIKLLKKIKSRITYEQLAPLYVSEKLKKVYSGVSVCGGALVDKFVVITGASTGIGFQIAKRLLHEGARVLLISSNEAKLKNAVERLDNKNVQYICWDCSDFNKIGEIYEKIMVLNNHDTISGWVNCHGMFSEWDRTRAFRKVNRDDLEYELRVNMNSIYFINNYIAERMYENNWRGTILSIASTCAYMRSAMYTPYGLSKTGILAITKDIAEKYKGTGVTVLAVAPGDVATNFTSINGESRNISLERNIIKRFALPEEIAAIVVALLSPMGQSLNGEILIASACDKF